MCKNLVGMLFGAAVSLSSAHAIAAEDVFSAAGASAAAIQGQVDAFRTSLGTLNANVAGSFASGRRESIGTVYQMPYRRLTTCRRTSSTSTRRAGPCLAARHRASR
jgi:hypothetical protein